MLLAGVLSGRWWFLHHELPCWAWASRGVGALMLRLIWHAECPKVVLPRWRFDWMAVPVMAPRPLRPAVQPSGVRRWVRTRPERQPLQCRQMLNHAHFYSAAQQRERAFTGWHALLLPLLG